MVSMPRSSYPTDLTDTQWAALAPLIPPPKHGGRPREHDMREIMNALFYVAKTGCHWRMLPHDLPKWKTVYDYFQMWAKDGTWQRMHDEMRRKVRKKVGRNEEPSAGSIDSQSAKTAEKGGLVAMMLGRR